MPENASPNGNTLDIKLVGLNTLRDEVLYLEPDQESLNLMKAMFHKLEMHFHAAGIQDKFRFRPHATIMKASQLRGHQKASAPDYSEDPALPARGLGRVQQDLGHVLREGSAAPGHAPSCRWLLRS